MIPHFSNPGLLVQETEIVSRVDIDGDDGVSNTPLDQEEDKEYLAALERIVKRSLGDVELVSPVGARGKKRRKFENQPADDSGPPEAPIPFRLVSSSAKLISLKSKPPPELKVAERAIEDDEPDAILRAQRAAAVAVDASQLIAEAQIPSYPRYDAGKKVMRVELDTLPTTPFFVVERPKTQTASFSLAASMLNLPPKILPNPHDFPAERLCCPVLKVDPISTKRKGRRKSRTQPESIPHPASFWRPPQELGGKSRGYALGYTGSRPIPTGSVRQWTYRRDRMKKGTFVP